VTPTPGRPLSQLVLAPSGTLSSFCFKTPIRWPPEAARTGYLVADIETSMKVAREHGADGGRRHVPRSDRSRSRRLPESASARPYRARAMSTRGPEYSIEHRPDIQSSDLIPVSPTCLSPRVEWSAPRRSNSKFV